MFHRHLHPLSGVAGAVRLTTYALLIVHLGGCATEVGQYRRLREVCAPPGDLGPVLRVVSGEGVPAELDRTIPAPCVRALGNALHVEWDAFGREPDAISTILDGSDIAIAGMYTLVVADTGTIAALERDVDPVEYLGMAYPDGLGPEGDPASAWWLATVTGHTAWLAPGERESDDTAMARHGAYEETTIYADSWLDAEGALRYPQYPFGEYAAEVLVHEASHSLVESHIRNLDDRLVDPDPARAFGMEFRYRREFYLSHPDELSDEEVNAMNGLDCSLAILDATGFSACEPP